MTAHPLFHRLALDAAKAGLCWLVALLILEAALPGFVSRFFNLAWVLIFAFAAAIAAFATHHPALTASGDRSADEPKGGAAFIRLLGLGAAAYAWLALASRASFTWRAAACIAILALVALLPIAFDPLRK